MPSIPPTTSRRFEAELRRLRAGAHDGWADLARDADLRTRAGWLVVLGRIGPKRLLLGLGGLLVMAILFWPGGDASADPFDGPAAAIDLLLKLGIVLALAYASLAVLKRYTVGATRPTAMLEVLDSTTLAPNRAVYVVRVGEKRLVLGVTTTQITALAELDPEATPEAPPSDVSANILSSPAPDGTSETQAIDDRALDAPPSRRRTFADHLAHADLTDPSQVNGHTGQAAPMCGRPTVPPPADAPPAAQSGAYSA